MIHPQKELFTNAVLSSSQAENKNIYTCYSAPGYALNLLSCKKEEKEGGG